MKRETPFQEISAEQLRDHAQPARMDRIWRRIEQDLTPRPRRRERSRWIWAPAAAACIFGAGVLVGARFFGAEPPLSTNVTPEPALASGPQSAPATASRVVVEPQRRPSVPKAKSAWRPSPAQAVEPQSSAAVVPLVLEPAVPEPAPVVAAGPPEWQRLADDLHYPEALAAIERAGGFDAILGDATAEQLMLLVDVARDSKQRDRAIMALRRVVTEHGSDPNAPLAAWMLGNELAKAGDQAGAAQAFAMYRALSPNGDFAEDALAREFEAAIAQGNLEHAHKLAEEYTKAFPDGRRLEDIRAELEELHRGRATSSVSTAEATSSPSNAQASSTAPLSGSK